MTDEEFNEMIDAAVNVLGEGPLTVKLGPGDTRRLAPDDTKRLGFELQFLRRMPKGILPIRPRQ
jgi:hypothetical protein